MRIAHIAAILFACSAAAYAQTASAPAGSAARESVTAAPADFSTPSAATASFLAASTTGNVQSILDAMTIDEKDLPLVKPVAELSAAYARLHNAMLAKYGEAEMANAKLQDLVPSPATIKKVAAATATIDGDKATMNVSVTPGEPEREVHLKKAGAAWKVDAGATMKFADEAARSEAKRLAPVVAACIAAAADTQKEVDSGKWPTPAAARRALQERLLAAAKAGENP